MFYVSYLLIIYYIIFNLIIFNIYILIFFMKQLLSFLTIYYKSLWLFFLFTLKPYFTFYFLFLFDLVNNIIKNLLSFWKITNYGDAYWFLFSNKRVIYEALFI